MRKSIDSPSTEMMQEHQLVTLKQSYDDFPLIHAACNKTAVNVDSIEAMTRETDYKVRGTFIHVEYPGQPLTVSCRYYKGMQYFSKTLMDGEEYVIPLSVARHINERIENETHKHLTDGNGNAIKGSKKISKCKFMIAGRA